ncbi:MAG: valine--tRNA ligase [Tannerellaceae bacterium]|jgi:valyl-tRNA synthetase|nr:valine--tRNA ligase [Tannerellaceae bacterium]
MEINSKYNPEAVECKWYAYWLKHELFKSVPDERKPFTIVIPPPNVTGVLHMGHMLNNTIQDILVRRARMMGFNACWVPGTDHASIATEAKVVAKLESEGLPKKNLTREKFLVHAWEWTHKHGGIILEQLKKLGASCDWSRTCFTMDGPRSESVIRVFVDLYNKGLIYRGVRMINWDPAAQTAISDEEVIHREEHGKLYYLRYMIAGDNENEYCTVATTRPETIFGDVAVCIHPDDPKTEHLKGKLVTVPIAGRIVPIIEDEYVDREFGTGCLKVTPAHDVNDYMLGQKYGLETIDIFNDDGTLNAHGMMYAGMDRFDVRKQIVEDLKAAGLMEKEEDYTNKVGYSERRHVPIEPKLSMQWFLKMEELAKPALEAVENDVIRFHPAKFKHIYRHWMVNIHDWNISRQLWWGHRIPAWYLPDGGLVVAENDSQALQIAREKTGNPSLSLSDLRQDEDCLDTWFSSWLWPISVFDGINKPDNDDISYYYPTSDLVTGPDIIFFWVARMIISGYEYRKEPCFGNVYFTGLVRDKQGRKMSKSLGNSPDPVELMNEYGADGVRMGMLLTAPAGNDLPFDDKVLCTQGRNFSNKIWNAFRLVKGWTVSDAIRQPEASAIAAEWFTSFLNRTIAEIDDLCAKYRLSESLMLVYKLFWDEFSSWYLEIVKPAYGQPVDGTTLRTTLGFFDALLRLLHPFMPFITEELWQAIELRKDGESIMIAPMPSGGDVDYNILTNFEMTKEIIVNIREVYHRYGVKKYEANALCIDADNDLWGKAVIEKLSGVYIRSVEEHSPARLFLVQGRKYSVDLGESRTDLDSEKLARLEKDLAYQQGFLQSVMKKLSNERFVANAHPDVVANERKKQADAENNIKNLEVSIAALKNI